MLWELPVSREAVKSKYHKLRSGLRVTQGSKGRVEGYPQPLPTKNISVIFDRRYRANNF
jgi:hypothetical protein